MDSSKPSERPFHRQRRRAAEAQAKTPPRRRGAASLTGWAVQPEFYCAEQEFSDSNRSLLALN